MDAKEKATLHVGCSGIAEAEGVEEGLGEGVEEPGVDDPGDGDEADDHGDEEEKAEVEVEGAALDFVFVPGLPGEEELQIAGVGFEEDGGDGAGTGDEADEEIDAHIECHAQEGGDGDAAAEGIEQDDEACARGDGVAEGGDEGEDGIETEADVGAGDAHELVEVLGKDACGGVVDGVFAGGELGGDGIDRVRWEHLVDFEVRGGERHGRGYAEGG